MEALATHALALTAVVFLLGVKHGFDPDHLAAIDGLTRYNASRRPSVSRWSGLLFSAGHGLVVTLVAVAVATVATEWRAPDWLGNTGAFISIAFLGTLGMANLLAVARTPRGELVRAAGLHSHLFAGLTRTGHPVLIAAVGAAFALSFDTISQAVLFSVTGSQIAGWLFAAMLGVVFTAGVMATDALNGGFVSGLIARADARAAIASRVMSLAIAFLALAIAAVGALRFASPGLEATLAEGRTAIGVAILLLIAGAYVAALRIAYRFARA